MDKVEIQGKTFVPMIPHAEIMEIIQELAGVLNREYKDSKEPPMLLCTLHGAIPFTGALMTALEFDPVISCIKVSTYTGMESTGAFKNVIGPTIPVEGQDVIILEDIVDTGITVRLLRQLLAEQGARSVKVCTMLFKPDKFHAEELRSGEMIKPEYIGREIANQFILGFGLDYDEFGRCLKDIYVLEN